MHRHECRRGTPGAVQAFVGTAASSFAIPPPFGWTNVYGSALNAFGQVTGYGTNPLGFEQAFIGTMAGSAAIPIPAGSNYGGTRGLAVNASGQVVGIAFRNSGEQVFQAFIGTAAGSALVPFPSGWQFSEGWAVNDAGQAVGVLSSNTFVGAPCLQAKQQPQSGHNRLTASGLLLAKAM